VIVQFLLAMAIIVVPILIAMHQCWATTRNVTATRNGPRVTDGLRQLRPRARVNELNSRPIARRLIAAN
jgi:hypothetical protein